MSNTAPESPNNGSDMDISDNGKDVVGQASMTATTPVATEAVIEDFDEEEGEGGASSTAQTQTVEASASTSTVTYSAPEKLLSPTQMLLQHMQKVSKGKWKSFGGLTSSRVPISQPGSQEIWEASFYYGNLYHPIHTARGTSKKDAKRRAAEWALNWLLENRLYR